MSGRISLSRRDAEGLLDLLGHFYSPPAGSSDAQVIDRLRSALTPSPKKRAATKARKAAKGAKRAAHNEETTEIRAAALQRAGSFCECGCGRQFSSFNPAEMDHAESRRVRQTIRNVWMLTTHCHGLRTLNAPSAAFWLAKWIKHCDRHGYTAEASRARARLASLSDVAEAAALTGGGR